MGTTMADAGALRPATPTPAPGPEGLAAVLELAVRALGRVVAG
jgi:hypothetical protein